MRPLCGLILLCLLSLSTNAYSAPDDHTGPSLDAECRHNPEYCEALALGFVFGSIASNDLPFKLCMPPSTTAQELGKLLIDYMERRPERLYVGQLGLVLEAVVSRFRCKAPIDNG